MKQKHAPTNPRQILMRRLLREHVRPYLPQILGALGFMAITGAATAAAAWLMQPVIDGIFQNRDGKMLMTVCISILVVFTIRGISTYSQNNIMNAVGQKIVADLQNRLFKVLVHADLATIHRNQSGEFISRMVSDIMVIRQALAEGLTNFGRNIFTMIFLIAVMFEKDWKMALVSLTIFPPTLFWIGRMGKKIRKLVGHSQAELGYFVSDVNQVVQNMRPIKAYGMEDAEQTHMAGRINSLRRMIVKQYRISSLNAPINDILSGIAIVALISYGGYEVIAGRGTAGEFFSFLTAFMMAYDPLRRLSQLNTVMQSGLACAERVFAMIDDAPTIRDAPNAVSLTVENAEIVFDDVTFRYDGATDAALDRVSLTIPSGKTVALVGASGAGKSTILNMIPRFYDPESGSIRIDGQDITGVTLASLRQHIAMVSQETALFDDTIFHNIETGKPGASEAEVVAAAKAAAADGFIEKLAEGYQTRIGEAGVSLSGGQRQRIAIARAILRNAPILLLDEATSALDAQSERAVQEALSGLRKGRTTLIVAHRLSTIVDADVIHVMQHGKIVESGTHASLLALNGVYRTLYGLQHDGSSSGSHEMLIAI